MAAKNKFLNAMKMPSIDDMFSSEADRQRESGDLVTEVPLSELHPFVGHPFEVRDDEDMQKLVDSIRENGVLTNLTVRRRAEGGYEIISGHRRFHAAQRLSLITHLRAHETPEHLVCRLLLEKKNFDIAIFV